MCYFFNAEAERRGDAEFSANRLSHKPLNMPCFIKLVFYASLRLSASALKNSTHVYLGLCAFMFLLNFI